MSRRSRVPYVPMAVDYWLDHALAEVFAESPLAEVMWCRLLSAAKKSKADGFVPRGAVLALGVTHWKRTMPLLVRAGVVDEVDGGWQVRSWLKHNDTQEEIEAELERKRINIQKWREKRRANGASVIDDEPDSKPPNESDVTELVTGYDTDHVPGTYHGRHLTPDTRHLTPDSPNGTLGVCSSVAATSSKRRRQPSETFDAVTAALANHGMTVPGGTITELGKVAQRSGRTPEFVVGLAVRLARVDHVDLAECTVAERSRTLSAVAQVAALTDDVDEVARRAANARDAGERSIADALKHRWSKHDTPTRPSSARSTAVSRQVAAADRLLAEIEATEAAGGTYEFPSLRTIGAQP